MKQRHRFHGTSWESLEDRQLLNGATGARMLARLHQRAAHVAAAGHKVRAARVPHGTWAGGQANQVVPQQATVSQSFTTPQASGAASPLPSFLDVHPTATSHPLTAQDLAAVTSTSSSSSSATGQIVLNQAALGFAGSSLNSVGAGGYASLKPGSYPSQASGDSILLGTTNVGAPSSPTSGTTGATVTLAGLPTGTGTSTGNTSTTTSTSTDPSTTPTTAPTVASTSTDPAIAPGSVTTAGTTTVAPAAMPMMPPLVSGLLDSTTLTPAEVNGLKQAVDTFAGAYTSGADAVKDKAAADALKSSLDDLAVATWSQSHVATPANVTALQKSVDGFASSYTGGTNPSADVAAWKALQSGLDAFNKGLMGQTAGTGPVTTSAAGTVTAGTVSTGTVTTAATGTASTSGVTTTGTGTVSTTASAVPVPTSAGGSLFANAPAMIARPMGGGGFKVLEAGLLNGPALTADEVNTLKTSVDTFAAAYTAGADATKDKAAADALQSSLSSLLFGHWQKAMPNSPNTMMPLAKGTTGVGTPSTATATITATTATPTTTPKTSPTTTAPTVNPVQFFMSRPKSLPGGPLGIAGLKGISATNLFTTTGAPNGFA